LPSPHVSPHDSRRAGNPKRLSTHQSKTRQQTPQASVNQAKPTQPNKYPMSPLLMATRRRQRIPSIPDLLVNEQTKLDRRPTAR
jgi:hypothetical protein